MKKDINYALVEGKRPPLYTCMKYWGKKPHNIWREYISNYTSNGVYLDAFCGSAMSAFESFMAGKKACAFDLNPLSSFIIEVICSDFDEKIFKESVQCLYDKIFNNQIFKNLYRYQSDDYLIQNVKYNEEVPYEICIVSNDEKEKKCFLPTALDLKSIEYGNKLLIDKMHPSKKFRQSEAFQSAFKQNIGDAFSDIYTKRNLWVLTEIFNEILAVKDEMVKKQLLYGFIQTVHLSTRMCVPRSKSTQRDFSTSWGRSAYIYSKKQMEMNPLLLFKNCCLGKQSVLKSLRFAKEYFPKKPIIADVNETQYDSRRNVDIWYGVVDAQNLASVLSKGSVEFVLTDPPYGGLVHYLDLSSIWLSWLELYDKKYLPDYEKEITVNGKKDSLYFEETFTKALKNINYVLQDTGKLVLTFNNKNIQIWSMFLKSIENAGFRIEKVIHQQNKRSSESNVSDCYGMSASDYYIRCVKIDDKYLKQADKTEIEKTLIKLTVDIIEKRKEPTPFQILFNGLLAEMSFLNMDLSNFNADIQKFLLSHLEKEFVIIQNATNKAGAYWWLKDKKYNPEDENTLTNRVRHFIFQKLKEQPLHYNDIIGEMFREFPNGLTPDVKIIDSILSEMAVLKNNRWTVEEYA